MRIVGHLGSESNAHTFADFLFVQGIENQVEFEEGNGWAVWIAEEDKLAQASTLIAAFRQDPAGAQFQSQAKAAAGMRAKLAKGQAAYQKRVRDRRHLFRPLRDYGFGVLTYALIAVSVITSILSNFGNNQEPLRSLFISQVLPGPGSQGSALGLPEVLHGQIWRLLTPIFIHFGLLHLVFNMLWLRDLGSMIEARQSTWRLALLVLVLGVCSNLAQYYWSGPGFGGMSGVVYGLLGYIWIRGKLDPGSGLYLHPTTVAMMIIWFVACVSGILGPVANATHAAGLALGMGWGWVASLKYR